MSASIDRVFLRIAVLYALAGLCGGIFMSASHDHSLMPAHAHWLLLGWVSMFLYGLFYKTHPAAKTKLATVQFWLANIGALALCIAVGFIVTGHPQAEPGAAIGALFVLAGMIVFAVQVFRGTRS
jgi:peptidoglycan/LPS O-acetylase OafA/YrhL